MNNEVNMPVDPFFAEGVAIVAGGSGGIGAHICLALARAGSNVLVTYRSNADEAQRVMKGVRELGREAEIVQLDLCDCQAVAAMATRAHERFGRVHSVVYAAGPGLHMQFISQLDPAEWASVIATDVGGSFNLVHATLPVMKKAGGGAYVAVITAAVERVPIRDICSAAPKAAIEMLMRGVAKEEGRFGVRANCVGPGWIDAGLGREVMRTELTEEHIEQIRRSIPLRRIGQPEDIAEAVVFLLSSKASFISGQSLAVDGGMQL
ncbi:SDR family oxidoreductase [Pseudomonas marginalis]|uniref:SDR family oxidoreductase n=1 Tax=Pseudomonas marginalis TaxID=298 RepID=A0A9X9BQA6_PSEMA|nr:SDR family oxidoreductase [Pseudomonas marginalis]TWR56164.1 SDR family oxidoreductase [Pseudomonas marginalis]SEB61828.1 NAD(P)-dependent dehydrogenase, short-chain alcohol dehydrogenase family [Pseudomonas marginalis]